MRAGIGPRIGARVGGWFDAVPGADELERRQARLLLIALVALSVVFGFAGFNGLLRVLLGSATASPFANLTAFVVCLGLIAGLRAGSFRLVAIVTIVLLSVAFAVALAESPEITKGTYLALLTVPIVLAGLLLGRWWVLLIATGTIAGGILAAQVRVEPPAGTTPHLTDSLGNFLYAGILLTAIVLAFGGSLRATLTRIVAHERELEGARADLERSVADLRVQTDERTRLQAEVAQQSRLESIGRLAGGVAHDFNNLLTAIRGYAQLLDDDLTTDASAARRDLDGIQQAAEQAAALTRQLLAFSRRQELRPEVVEPGAIVTSVEALLRRLLGEQVQLVVRPAADGWPVLADRSQLEAVIVNLAVNARDAMPDGGTLTIETANVVLDRTYAGRHAEVSPGAYALIAVSDNGTGMDRETMSHIFEPFFTTKELGGGTGLGLATVYGTIRQFGGHIWVYSEPDQGTTFKIYLPRTERVAAPRSAPEPERRIGHRGQRVLLAEDEDLVREFIIAALERAGHSVVAVPSGEAALAVLADPNEQIGLLISDVVMPGIGGPELVERVWATRPGLPAILMSGYTAGALEGRPTPLGAILLEKPFTADELDATIAAVTLEGGASS